MYDEFLETLNEEQLKLFKEYSEWKNLFEGLIEEREYIDGLKVGLCMGLELVDFDPTEE